MKVRGVTFVGTRTSNFSPTTEFFRDVLGLETAFSRPNWSGYKCGSGEWDLVEVFDDDHRDERLVPFEGQSGTKVGSVADDISIAREEMERSGTEFTGDIVWLGDPTSDPSNTSIGQSQI